ncbi:MAG TPA: LuxR C-terminal-related transcriptional regulator [Bacteroidales bacterium]|jgi:DNA-binding CsgD family transcriptional regulator|nr:LuxR C-terminal-related transcriptional regulator [Bacteroidales bacterium]
MTAEIRKLYKEYSELLDMQKFKAEELDYRILDYHLPLLESIDVVDNGCLSVFDLYQRKHVYFSPKYETILGWDSKRAETDMEYTNSMIHPDDLPVLFRAGIYYMSLGFSMDDKRKSRDFKTIFDYRVKGRNGIYVRIIEQQVPLEFDPSGNVWLALSMLDLSPERDLKMPFRGMLKNQRTGELFRFPPDGELSKSSNLTNREKEILSLIAAGLISKEIADKLFISVNTVNTHRQRIIEKLNVSNTYEAIRYAHEKGLF